ncbi:MAG TPA: preQ(1) synthase [Rubrobacteraceae bacterium]|jgi:7-cyano-7-deazaguanine reductase|nr:preQ(1) synthase [Rubrobacteraceae bacterium]
MQQENNQILGRETRGPISAEQLDTVPWNHGDTDATVEFSTDELTAICPVTGQPDFYELKLTYRPRSRLLESKAMKLYLWGFRERGMFAEDMAASLLKDLVAACDPVEMNVDLTQQVRGGLKIRTVVQHTSTNG